MTSKIKVDNIENQCGGAVVTKCGGTTTIAGTNVNATTVTATNVVGSTAVKSNAIQASDGGNLVSQSGTTITLGASGDTINLASGASQSGFGRTGTVDWQTSIKTSTITVVSGEGYFVNTTGGAITANLPAGTAGAIASFRDYANTFDSNNLTISSNGSEKINGVTDNLVISAEGESLTLVYADATKGWLVVNDGNNDAGDQAAFITATGGTITTVDTNFKVHTFTGPGTFTVCSVGNAAGSNTVSYMVVAGGAGGGGEEGGGGGAGGFRESKASTDTYTASPLNATSGPGFNLPVSAQGYTITVGGGGNGQTADGVPAVNGNPSTFSSITSTGGGYGGGQDDQLGNPGGSGGGGHGDGSGNNRAGGTGNSPPVSPAQGTTGGTGVGRTGTTNEGAGGGGGATAIGSNGTTSPNPGGSGGPGGAGATSSINGTPTARAGGGGGAAAASGGVVGVGGTGGGGDGTKNNTTAGAGTDNTGSGGGGGGGNGGANGGARGGAGGSGIVIIRYKFQ
ncbi:hypothetical protein OAP46_00150 [bacterium]|nr:hypothetical protein [bacterium]